MFLVYNSGFHCPHVTIFQDVVNLFAPVQGDQHLGQGNLNLAFVNGDLVAPSHFVVAFTLGGSIPV